MLNLLLAIASSALVSITMRLSEGRTQNTVAKLMVNYLMCSLLSWLYAGSLVPQAAGIPFATKASTWSFMSAMRGVTTIVSPSSIRAGT